MWTYCKARQLHSNTWVSKMFFLVPRREGEKTNSFSFKICHGKAEKAALPVLCPRVLCRLDHLHSTTRFTTEAVSGLKTHAPQSCPEKGISPPSSTPWLSRAAPQVSGPPVDPKALVWVTGQLQPRDPHPPGNSSPCASPISPDVRAPGPGRREPGIKNIMNGLRWDRQGQPSGPAFCRLVTA